MAELTAKAAFQEAKVLDRSAPLLAGGAFAYAKFQLPATEKVQIVAVRADGSKTVLVEDTAPPVVKTNCIRLYEVRVRVVEDVPVAQSKIGVAEVAREEP